MGNLGSSFKDIKRHNERIREKKGKEFISKILPLLQENDNIKIYRVDANQYSVNINGEIIDLFIKIDRIRIRKSNKFVTGISGYLKDINCLEKS